MLHQEFDGNQTSDTSRDDKTRPSRLDPEEPDATAPLDSPGEVMSSYLQRMAPVAIRYQRFLWGLNGFFLGS